MARNYPGPWAEFQGDRVILTIPTEAAQKVVDPQALVEYYDKVSMQPTYTLQVMVDLEHQACMACCACAATSRSLQRQGGRHLHMYAMCAPHACSLWMLPLT